ncbi:MAG: hypothetical protein Q4P31_05505 [Andreesenia angusta]|nr:hypothetical protein [Andreesenia angusta]
MKKMRFKVFIFIGFIALFIGFTSLAIRGSSYSDYLGILENSIRSEDINYYTLDTDYDLKVDGTTNMSGKSKQMIEKKDGKFKKIYMDNYYKYLDKELNIQYYYDENKYIMKSSNGDYIENEDFKIDIIDNLDNIFTPRMRRILTAIMVGDAKNQASFDGEKFNMHLEGNQIPMLDKLLLGIIANLGEANIERQNEKLDGTYVYIENYMKMNNIDVQSIDYSSNVKDDKLKDISIKVIITADDSFGYKKNIEINFFGVLSYDKKSIPEIVEDIGD